MLGKLRFLWPSCVFYHRAPLPSPISLSPRVQNLYIQPGVVPVTTYLEWTQTLSIARTYLIQGSMSGSELRDLFPLCPSEILFPIPDSPRHTPCTPTTSAWYICWCFPLLSSPHVLCLPPMTCMPCLLFCPLDNQPSSACLADCCCAAFCGRLPSFPVEFWSASTPLLFLSASM